MIRELIPLLFVENIAKSVAFYRESLGFAITMKWEPDGNLGWCRMERDGVAIMLQQACEEDGPSAGRGRGVEFFFNCDDAAVLHAEFVANGLTVAPPKLAFYGMNQVFVNDLDGYGLCFQNATSA